MKAITKFINGLGDWNHAFIVAIGIWPVATIIWLCGYPLATAMFWAASMWAAFYLGKEHLSYRWYTDPHGFWLSVNPFAWNNHDKYQTLYMVIVAYGLAALIDWWLPSIGY
jgi:hypothetical protein